MLYVEDKLPFLEQPMLAMPVPHAGQVHPLDVLNTHTAWVKDSKEITGLMLMTMDPDIQKNLEHLGAYDMLKELKTFMEKTVTELHVMPKLHEQTLPSTEVSPALHAIRAGRIQKNQKKKSHKAAKGNQGKCKAKIGYAYVPAPPFATKPKNPPTPKKDNPAKDVICHQCGEVGHWRCNYLIYLAELMKKKKLSQGASTSDIFTIELYSFLSTSWVYDTGYGTHIYLTSQCLRRSRKLKPGALSLYVGDGHRATVEAIGEFHLCLPIGLVLILHNCHYAHSITRGIILVSHLYKDGFVNRFKNDISVFVSRNNLIYFNAIPLDDIYEIVLSSSNTNDSSIQNRDEPCVYVKASGSYVTFLILYVDDILIMGNNILMLQDVKSYFGRCFAIKDLGKAAYILGIKIYQDRSKRLIGLCQSAYIEKILKRFYLENSKRGTIPMQEKLKLSKSQGASTPAELQRMQNILYAFAVGSIMYVVGCTRPDVAFAENITSRFQHNLGDTKRELKVSCYTDAGYLTDQSIFATSSTDAEYIAAFDASKEAVWIRKISRLGVVPIIEDPIYIYCDNTGATAIAKGHGVTEGARHFYAKVHYLRETIKMGDVKIEKVDTYGNLADHFTKALAFPKHSELTKKIGMIPTVTNLSDDDHKRLQYKAMHEEARKDVEREFGVLKKQWAMLATLAWAYIKEKLTNIMYTCIILPNMIIKDRKEAICPE
nr:hypothetical protein [Tanacetum cinerariifolium]